MMGVWCATAGTSGWTLRLRDPRIDFPQQISSQAAVGPQPKAANRWFMTMDQWLTYGWLMMVG